MSEVQQLKLGEWIEHEEQNIATRLSVIREELAIGRRWLSNMAEITEDELAEYENGLTPIPVSMLFVFASVLGISVEYFFGGEAKICRSGVYHFVGNEQVVMLPN